ncbi:hypothetical protein NDU88_002356 [Pleurodeles waltl]|uniref:Uncharacterized protein n=1 Tax=Pleurodeles waltl TaxID=8319 RepID=A0AAV7Q5R9_PLEWA|nr:hypothetical protein NDU88_002356 [Pleurodeles waltl]
MAPGEIHRNAVSAGVGRAKSEQGTHFSPNAPSKGVRAQTRLESLRKNAREYQSARKSARKSALWWTRLRLNIDRARAEKSLLRVKLLFNQDSNTRTRDQLQG